LTVINPSHRRRIIRPSLQHQAASPTQAQRPSQPQGRLAAVPYHAREIEMLSPATPSRPSTPSSADAIVAATNQLRLSRLAAAPAEEPARKARKARKASRTVRRSVRIPRSEYRQLAQLKKRLARGGVGIGKGQLFRAGLMLLAGLDLSALKAAISDVLAPAAAPRKGK